ncbi:MAG: hypothetical protein Q4D63_03600 [Neisseria animaloris]|nr:hypothetical protein [Neisseria animaloris]
MEHFHLSEKDYRYTAALPFLNFRVQFDKQSFNIRPFDAAGYGAAEYRGKCPLVFFS